MRNEIVAQITGRKRRASEVADMLNTRPAPDPARTGPGLLASQRKTTHDALDRLHRGPDGGDVRPPSNATAGHLPVHHEGTHGVPPNAE